MSAREFAIIFTAHLSCRISTVNPYQVSINHPDARDSCAEFHITDRGVALLVGQYCGET